MAKIQVWFNPTHGLYKTDYRQFIQDEKPGFINKRGHILIDTIYLFDDKVFYSREGLDIYVYRKINSPKRRALLKLKDYINKKL